MAEERKAETKIDDDFLALLLRTAGLEDSVALEMQQPNLEEINTVTKTKEELQNRVSAAIAEEPKPMILEGGASKPLEHLNRGSLTKALSQDGAIPTEQQMDETYAGYQSLGKSESYAGPQS